jgi:hypothetical protein
VRNSAYPHRILTKYTFSRAPGWRLAKKSPLPPIPLSTLPNVYGIRWFDWSIDAFLEEYFPNLTFGFSPDDRLTVFPKATQVINDAFVTGQVDIVHASPLPFSSGTYKSKFDTVLIRKVAPDNLVPGQLSYGMSSK